MTKLSRRRFLKALGWSAAGITVVAGSATWALMPTLPPRNAPTSADAAAWLSLRPDGRFELHSSRVEMGQGISMGLRQVVADELGVDLSLVRVVRPVTDLLPVARSTVGSDSMRETGVLLARAASALNQSILHVAARRLRQPSDTLRLGTHGVTDRNEILLRFDELGSGPPILISAEDVKSAVPRLLSKPDERREVGRPYPTEDLDAIVTGGRALYADDIRLPGMVFGSAIRPSTLEGRIVSIDAAASMKQKGVLGVFRDGDFAGIIASRRGALAKALELLNIEETIGFSGDTAQVLSMVDIKSTSDAHEHDLIDTGDAETGHFDVDLMLSTPFAAHASIEPRTAVARFGDDGTLEVWTGTQDPFFVRDSLADIFRLSRAAVVVHGMRIGGGFGARTIVSVELEAARLARLCGRPVKVQWSRRDEFQAGFHRPPTSHRIRVAAGSDGRILKWHHVIRSGHVIFTSAAMGPSLQFATSFIADPGVTRGAKPPYAAVSSRVSVEDVRLPVKTGPWRGLGAGPNCWAVETAIDALARAKNIDPLAFRMNTIAPEHRRLRAVLTAVAEMSDWKERALQGRGEAKGLACGIYKEMSYAAAVAQVTKTDGRFKVTRLWCAHDCGLIVNPDQVRAQIEGNLVWGMGMALKEELMVENGQISAESFFDYPMPVLSDVPNIEIQLIEGGPNPSGAGETAMVCAAAAITNAITALTGETITKLPLCTA